VAHANRCPVAVNLQNNAVRLRPIFSVIVWRSLVVVARFRQISICAYCSGEAFSRLNLACSHFFCQGRLSAAMFWSRDEKLSLTFFTLRLFGTPWSLEHFTSWNLCVIHSSVTICCRFSLRGSIVPRLGRRGPCFRGISASVPFSGCTRSICCNAIFPGFQCFWGNDRVDRAGW